MSWISRRTSGRDAHAVCELVVSTATVPNAHLAALPERCDLASSLEPHDARDRAVQHAKLVVADGRRTLITSANFSEAAHERNLEAGVLVDDVRLAARVQRQVDALIAKGRLRPVPLAGRD